jgi:hypothetical protein
MHCCLTGKKWYIQGLINYVIFCTNSTNSYISSYTTMHMQTWQMVFVLISHHNTHINYTPSPLVLTVYCDFYWLYCSLWSSWLTIKHLFVCLFIYIYTSYIINIQKFIYSHAHSSVPFYQTTIYKVKMQLLKGLWQTNIYLYKQLIDH